LQFSVEFVKAPPSHRTPVRKSRKQGGKREVTSGLEDPGAMSAPRGKEENVNYEAKALSQEYEFIGRIFG